MAETRGTMRKWTDKDYTLRLKGFDFNSVEGIIVTVRQNGTDIFETNSAAVVSSDTIQFHVTQAQSGALHAHQLAELFVDWYEGGKRDGWGPLKLNVLPNSPQEERAYGG